MAASKFIRYICTMRMSKLYWIAALLPAVFSCKGNSTEITDLKDVPQVKLSFEERVERHVTGSLSIPPNEKFTTQIYRAHLNADNNEDAIITVNRLDFAMKRVANVPNGKQIEEMGYMGNDNYFICYDGKLDKFSVPVPVASSAKAPLVVKFENILSESYKDLTIEYRVINSAYKNYYAMNNGTLQKIFLVKLFDKVGEPKPESVFIEYDKGSISSAKDILVYEGKIKNYATSIPDVYTYNPEIEKGGKLLFRWFFNPSTMQYMTQNTAALPKEN